MGPIVLSGFAGANIALGPRLLPESVGVSVLDANPLLPGDLRPLKSALAVATAVVGRQTIYRMGRDVPSESNYWLSFTGHANIIRGFDAEDTSERTYYTGDGVPKWTDNVMALGSAPYPAAWRPLAMPAPTIMPTLSVTTPGTGDAGYMTYVYTWVNDLGWESAPSPVNGITIAPGAVVAIGMPDTPPTGNYGINRTRIYRTSVDTAGTSTFLFLREVTLATTSTSDDGRALGDQLATVGWLPLPDGAYGLIALWAGMAAAVYGKEVLFNEPGVMYAWPEKYAIAVVDTPVATGRFEQNLVVLTDGHPVVIQGTDPAGMTDTLLPIAQPCAAAASVASFAHGVVWASNEGIAYFGVNGQALLTQGLIKPEQWRALVPASMVAARWGRMYVVFYDDGTGRKGLMIDPLAPANGVWFLSTGFAAAFYDELLQALYVLDGAAVKRFDGGAAPLSAVFRSKAFRQTGGRNMTHGEVTADAYPVTFKLWGDGVLRMTRTVTNDQPFTLPAGYMATDYQVEVTTTAPLQSVRLGTIAQLRGEAG